MSPKADVSVERKQQIYQAALACFNRKGYYQTTMDDIVAESGLSKGTLYWYFDSKKALFIDLLADFMEPLSQEWATVTSDPGLSVVDKLKASMALFRAQIPEMVRFFGIVMEAWTQTHFDEDVQRLSREMYRPYLALMNDLLEEGVATGELSVEDTRATSAVILTMFDGLTLAIGMGILDQDTVSLLDAAERLVLQGLGIDSGE